MPSQLGIDNLVAPSPKPASRLHPNQEISIPKPPPVKESRLVDDIAPEPDRSLRFSSGKPEPLPAIPDIRLKLDPCDPPTTSLQLSEIARLMLATALLNDVKLRIRPNGPMNKPSNPSQLKVRKVIASKKPNKIRSRENGLAVNLLQVWSLPPDNEDIGRAVKAGPGVRAKAR